MRLKNMVYTAEDRLIELYDQLAELGAFRLKGGKGGLKLPFAHAEAEIERVNPVPEGWADLVQIVSAGLRDSGQLSALRPLDIPEYGDFRSDGLSYVYETDITARRVQIPVSEDLQDEGCPPAIRVWVAEPDRLPEPTAANAVTGTFLYLVEDLVPADPPAPPWFFSGASALAHVARLAQPERFQDSPTQPGRFYDPGERLGRHSDADPPHKLEQIGARLGLPRNVDALYQIRYMTNEQMFVPSGSDEGRRVNDLMGYPLAIWVE